MRWKLSVWLMLLLVLLTVAPTFGQTPAQAPNTWSEWANTNFTTWSVPAGVNALHESCWPSSGVGAAISAWVSGAYHSGLDEWFSLRGGGHADGCLNGVFALKFTNNVPAWSIRVAPTLTAVPKMNSENPTDANFKAQNTDGTPASVHGYGNSDCIPPDAMYNGQPHPLRGQCVSSGGIFWSHAGLSVPGAVFWLDPTKPDALTAWTRKKDRPGGYGVSLGYNAGRARFLVMTSGGAYDWNPVDDSYVALFTGQAINTSTSPPAFTKDGSKAYVIIAGSSINSRLKVLNYATAATTKYTQITTTGGDGIENATAPGFFVVSEANNQIRLVGVGRKTVTIPPVPPSTTPTTAVRTAIFTLIDDGVCGRGTATPCAWTHVVPTNPTTNLPPAPSANGMWKRIFVRGCDIFTVVSGNGNVWSYRPEFAMDSCAPLVVKFPLTITEPVGGGTGLSNPPAGTYQLNRNTVQALTFSPTGGSKFTGWAGDEDCTDGSVTMTGPRTCTPQVQAPDTTPPSIQITQPPQGTSGRPPILSGSFNVEFSAQDNVGVTAILVDLNGANLTAPYLIDTKLMANGSYNTVQVRATDEAGNTTSESREFIAFNCAVCEPPKPVKYTLTVAKAGTGDGTVGGGGEYEAGQTVTLTATPNAESDEGAWAPAPCAATFQMPAAALTCTKTFTKKPPPVSNLPPANTWRFLPHFNSDGTATSRVGKHFRCFKDLKRNQYVCTGGDRAADPYNPAGEQGSDSGNPAITVLDPSNGTTLGLAAPKCPAAPAIMPAFPDNVIWVHDTLRDVYLMFRGFFFGQVNATTGSNIPKTQCGRDMWTQSPTYDPNVLMKDVEFNPTDRVWSQHSWPVSPYGYGSDGSGPTFGVYDKVTDSVFMFKKDGAWGGVLMILRRATNTWEIAKLGEKHPSGSDQRNMLRNAIVYRSSPTVLNGKIYVMSFRGNQPDPTVPNNSALLEIDAVNPNTLEGQTAYRVPAGWNLPENNAEEIEGYALALPKKNLIIHPFSPGLTTRLYSLYAFDTVARQWLPIRQVPTAPEVPEQINGGNWIYDDATEEIVVLGRRVKNFRGYGQWRYRWE